VGKAQMLGFIFGMGAEAHRRNLAEGRTGPKVEITPSQAVVNVNSFRNNFLRFRTVWNYLDEVLMEMANGNSGVVRLANRDLIEFDPESLWMPNGLPMVYPELHQTDYGGYAYQSINPKVKLTNSYYWVRMYKTKLFENIVQCLARIIMSEAVYRVSKKYKILMFTHDEIVTLIPETDAQQHSEWISKQLKIPPSFCSDLVLDVEGSYGERYSK